MLKDLNAISEGNHIVISQNSPEQPGYFNHKSRGEFQKTHSLVKRIVNGIEIGVSRNGFGAIMQTEQANSPLKSQKICLKWVYLPIFKRWICKNITINRPKL